MRTTLPGAILLVLIRLPASPAAPIDSHAKAVVIGIPDYPDDQFTAPLPFADRDAQLFHDQIAARAAFGSRQLLDQPRVGHFTAMWYLNKALAQAVPGDTIYIFVSSRGMARPGAAEGYLGTSNLVMENPPATAVPVSYLRTLIESSAASRVILFADVSRAPQGTPANMINTLLADLGKIRKPVVSGILASAPGQVSQVKEELKHGVFGYYLVNAGSRGSVDIPALWSALSDQVKLATNGSQKPQQIGKESAPLWRIARTPQLEAPPVDFARYPAEFAAASWFGALLALQTPAQAQLRSLAEQIRPGNEIRDPLNVAAQILNLQSHTSSTEWSGVRELALTALADQGQKYVSRYGIQDMLPDDPLRVSPAQYRLAADSFRAALRLLPEDKSLQHFRNMMTVRGLLCEAGSGVPDKRPILETANKLTDASIPDVENALGITYLEGQQKDYERAVAHLRKAKLVSPAWLYPRHNLALAYIEQGKYQDAETEYRDAIATRSPQPYVHYNYGLLLQRLNRYAEARGQYEEALKGYDNAVQTLEARGKEWAVHLPGDSQLALQRAAIFRRNKAEVLNAIGTLLDGRGNLAGAQPYFQAARQQNPALWPASYNLAKLAQRIAEKKDKAAVSPLAVSLLNECTRITADIHPRLLLAQLYLRGNKPEGAREQWIAVNKQSPDNVESLIGLAQIERANNNFPAAIGWLNQAIAAEIRNQAAPPRPTDAKAQPSATTRAIAYPDLYADLAETYRLAGDSAGCRTAYDSAIASTKGSTYGSRVKLLLKARSCEKTSMRAR